MVYFFTICGTLINEKSHGHHKQRMLNQSWRNSASKLRNPGMKSNLVIVLSGLGRKVMVGPILGNWGTCYCDVLAEDGTMSAALYFTDCRRGNRKYPL